MKTNCKNYAICRLPVKCCNNKCSYLNKTCEDCYYNWFNEKCSLTREDITKDMFPCFNFEEK